MSTIIADNLTGKTSAGSVTVTSEGGAATQSLQQGLSKCWAIINQNTPAVRDSLNLASITDNGTGNFTLNISNAMSSVNYGGAGTGSYIGTDTSYNFMIMPTDNPTTTTIKFQTPNYGTGTLFDNEYQSAILHGDLA